MRMRVHRRGDEPAVDVSPDIDRAPVSSRVAGRLPVGQLSADQARIALQHGGAAAGLLGLQGAVGNRAVARLVAAQGMPVQRHSEDEAAQGIDADDAGNVMPVQRDKVRSVSDVKATFDAEYALNKDRAVNFLKRKYGLDTKPYDLSVVDLGQPHTHGVTNGGWNSSGSRFTNISVEVNEPYADRSVATQDGFNKLIHTLGHEYQHVKQRSQKGWKTTGDDSAKGEREFLAYSWELVDAAKQKGMATLGTTELLATIGRALDMYAKMDPVLQQKHDKRYQQVLTLKIQNERRMMTRI